MTAQPSAPSPSVSSVKDAADQLRTTAVEGFHQLAHDLDGGLGDLRGAIRGAIAEHPLRAALLAAGTGYLLGGGLAAPLTRRLMRLGMRALLIPLLEEPTASFLEWVRSEFDSSGDTGSAKSSKNNPRAADEPTVAKGAKSHGNQ